VVLLDAAETWTGPGGGVEFATGRCTQCGSRVLFDPSTTANAVISARLDAVRAAAGG
jgi:hypothetical protein